MRTPEEQRWAVLGLGRAGFALGSVLDRQGSLVSAWTRTSERRDAHAAALSPRVSCLFGPPSIPAEADVVLVAVPDHAMKSTVLGLAPALRGDPERVWLHVSGAMDASAWETLGVAGPAGSCHPLVSMQADGRDAGRLQGAFFAIDGPAEAQAAARTLAEAVGGHAAVVEGTAARTAYHLAAVLASNGVYALLAAAGRVLGSAGLQDAELARALARLSADSAQAAVDRGAVDAATGPVVRGDARTVDRHLAWLDAHEPALKPLYRALCEELLEVAEGRGVRGQLLAALRHVLHR